MKKALYILIVLLGCFTTTAFAKESKAIDANAINHVLTVHPDRPFNGVVLISHSNHVMYEKALGNYGTPQIDSQFVIGSISKQLTATIIMSLVDKGLIDLDKSIYDYLPELKVPWARQVKVKNLLNHTSGIVAMNKPLKFTPGSKFMYSPTLNYYIASQIAEKASKKSYEKLLHALFVRSNMGNSDILISPNMHINYHKNPNLRPGFMEYHGKIKKVREIGLEGEQYDRTWLPSSGIVSTANDLLAWNIALHHGGLISQDSYKKMITPKVYRDHPRYGKIGYGFGVQVVEQDNYTEISHSGYIDGYMSTLLYYPQIQIGVVILENISWDQSNIKHAFNVHDEIRTIVRDYIKQLLVTNNEPLCVD